MAHIVLVRGQIQWHILVLLLSAARTYWNGCKLTNPSPPLILLNVFLLMAPNNESLRKWWRRERSGLNHFSSHILKLSFAYFEMRGEKVDIKILFFSQQNTFCDLLQIPSCCVSENLLANPPIEFHALNLPLSFTSEVSGSIRHVSFSPYGWSYQLSYRGRSFCRVSFRNSPKVWPVVVNPQCKSWAEVSE